MLTGFLPPSYEMVAFNNLAGFVVLCVMLYSWYSVLCIQPKKMSISPKTDSLLRPSYLATLKSWSNSLAILGPSLRNIGISTLLNRENPKDVSIEISVTYLMASLKLLDTTARNPKFCKWNEQEGRWPRPVSISTACIIHRTRKRKGTSATSSSVVSFHDLKYLQPQRNSACPNLQFATTDSSFGKHGQGHVFGTPSIQSGDTRCRGGMVKIWSDPFVS